MAGNGNTTTIPQFLGSADPEWRTSQLAARIRAALDFCNSNDDPNSDLAPWLSAAYMVALRRALGHEAQLQLETIRAAQSLSTPEPHDVALRRSA